MDAEVMIAALSRAGWSRHLQPDDADVIIVNSCGFIEPAKQESIDTALDFASQYPDSRIVMAGCLSQRYPLELAREMPELSGIVGNRTPARIASYLESILQSNQRVFVPEPHPAPGLAHLPRVNLLSFPGSAYVKVAEGCRNRCAFCAIPLIRGALRSRPTDEIVSEVGRLVESGIVEINLVAQDLGAYGADSGESIDKLIRRLLAVPSPFWIRPLYVYPEHFPESLIEICRSDPRLLPYFDIPIQHASPSVLRRMGRPDNPERTLDLIDRIRRNLPDAFIRSTFLVGFYGETHEDFDTLLDFQEQARIDWLGAFTYSPEDGTPAESYEGKIALPDPKTAERRRDVLFERQRAITHGRLDRLVGKEVDVIIEETVQGEDLALGRSYAQAPEVDGAVVVRAHQTVNPGRLLRCRIVRRNGLDVEAVPL